MKIKIVMPFKTDAVDEVTEKIARKYASQGTEIVCVHTQKGPESIENQYDDAFAVPGVLEEVGKAEEEGYDGVLISCFGDPGLKPARELANIPVVGTAESSMLFASALGQRFSIITILRNIVPLLEGLVQDLGIYGKLSSIRDVNVPVDRLKEIREAGKQMDLIYREAIKAIEEDDAHAIVLGGTCMAAVSPRLYKILREKKGYDIPVIDPVGASVKFLESLISLGLKQSKLTYMTPSEKERSI